MGGFSDIALLNLLVYVGGGLVLMVDILVYTHFGWFYIYPSSFAYFHGNRLKALIIIPFPIQCSLMSYGLIISINTVI